MTTSSSEELDRLRQEGKISEEEHRQIKQALEQRRQISGLRGIVPVARAESEREIAGVCAGLAKRFGIRPWNLRIAFLLLLALSSGFAVLAYLVLALLMPRGDARDTRPRHFPVAVFFLLASIALGHFLVARLSLPLLETGGAALPAMMSVLMRHATILWGIIVPLTFAILFSLFLYLLPDKGLVRRSLAWTLPAVSAAALVAVVIALAIAL